MGKKRPKPITKDLAAEFFAALDENEKHMGDGAALAVTLEQFGYENDQFDVLAEMLEAVEQSNG